MSKPSLRLIRASIVTLAILGGTVHSFSDLLFSQETEQLNELLKQSKNGQNKDRTHLVKWLTTLELAKEKTRIRRAPILLIAGAEWCIPCRALEEELQDPELQSELERWVPVHLDVDEETRTARELNISTIPAIRLLTPDGRITASREGFLDAETFTNWLQDQYDVSAESFLADFTETGIPNSIAIIRIVREFSKRDATLREAAITRLTPYPEVAAAHVLSKFAGGTLAEKLTAHELLKVWNAPVSQIDPWIPESLDQTSLKRLEKWLQEQTFSMTGKTSELSPSQILEAERLIRQMVTVDAVAATSMREQLSRMGDGVLPLLKEALLGETTPQVRSRLLAARYRLATDSERVLSWSGGIERMASSDFDERIKAINELTTTAKPQDQKLLLALFESPEPLIREMAIQTLQKVSENVEANSALAKLLDDPDANVRAAVLKYLAEKPSAKMIDRIRNYIDEENDPDLIVFAIRYLREIESPDAVDALLPLFQHVSWRVRADAAEAVTKLVDHYSVRNKINKEDFQKAMIGLLNDEDNFVVSKAILGLRELPGKIAFQPLLNTAQRSPELAPEIISTLTDEDRFETEFALHLKPFLNHDEPLVRAAAIAAYIELEKTSARTQAKQALSDSDSRVRVATVSGVVQQALDQIADIKKPRQRNPSQRQKLSPPAETDSVILAEIRKDKKLEPWIYDFAKAVESSSDSDGPEFRFQKDRLLAITGDKESIAFLIENATVPDYTTGIAALLPTMDWETRSILFEKLMQSAESNSKQYDIVRKFVSGNEPQATEVLWNFLGSEDASPSASSIFHRYFLTEYFPLGVYKIKDATKSEKEKLIEDCQAYLSQGARWQKVCALQLLVAIDLELAGKSAFEVYKNGSQPLEIRIDALKTFYWCDPENVFEIAAEGIQSDRDEVAELSLSFLALGKSAISTLSDGKRLYSYTRRDSTEATKSVINLNPPEKLQIEDFEKFKESSNPYILAQTGYLLALYGDSSYLPALQAAWEANPEETIYQRLLYRAIAKLDTPKNLETLKEIYAQLNRSESSAGEYIDVELQQFHLTIKQMKSPEAVALCKKILQEHPIINDF